MPTACFGGRAKVGNTRQGSANTAAAACACTAGAGEPLQLALTQPCCDHCQMEHYGGRAHNGTAPCSTPMTSATVLRRKTAIMTVRASQRGKKTPTTAPAQTNHIICSETHTGSIIAHASALGNRLQQGPALKPLEMGCSLAQHKHPPMRYIMKAKTIWKVKYL